MKNENEFFREIDIEFLIHELKDPLSVIETGVRTLLERRQTHGSLSLRQEKTLKRVLRNAQKARSMMYGLLEIGRSQAGCFSCTSFQLVPTVQDTLMEAVESVCPPVFDQINALDSPEETLAFLSSQCIYVCVDSEVSQLELHQDEVKFRQIAGNLIKNALHHRKKRVDIGLGCRNQVLWLEVSDDGPGIDAEHHEMVFRRYTQINACNAISRTGHGLGLAGALILAQSMGGTIEIISQKGKGATFRLMLPLALNSQDRVFSSSTP
ncbi:MAG: HAMP domain-containing sensor histidine kinase [Desulfatirhabdiaceae bacterium]|nr:HAMP domain-containing sensor histidine kinase [Desulfatirhabdiaceae bacterium]